MRPLGNDLQSTAPPQPRPELGPTASHAGVGRAFGTFGELIQGVLPDGRDFLVTLPVARWSVAVFQPRPEPRLRADPGREKSRTLAARMLEAHGLEPGGVLRISSALPVGKGMASSSADLVATARAVADAHGLRVSPSAIEDLMREIEPSDGVMHDGVVAYYHREVRLLARLGPPPPITVVGLDEGGVVDTIAFNQLPKPFTAEDRDEYRSLLDEAGRAVPAGDHERLGALATRSAVLNQRMRPKRLLDAALAVSRRCGALGVAAAHSGTKLGVLLAAADPDHDRKLVRVLTACRELGCEVSVDRTLSAAERLPAGPEPTRAAVPAAGRMTVLITTGSSDAHTWNLVFLQKVVEEAGHRVVNLGPCVPEDVLVDSCLRHKPDLIVFSSVNGHGLTDGLRVMDALRSAPGAAGVPAVIGGKLTTAGALTEEQLGRLVAAGFSAVFDDASLPAFKALLSEGKVVRHDAGVLAASG